MNKETQTILQRYDSDRTRLMDILWDIHDAFGHLPPALLPQLEAGLNISRNDILETASFYHFFHTKPTGTHQIYLSNTVLAKMNGYQGVYEALESATGSSFGVTEAGSEFSLFETSCIGLSDQEPAMLVDKIAFTHLTPSKVHYLIEQLKQGKTAEQIANPAGLVNTELDYVENQVESNDK